MKKKKLLVVLLLLLIALYAVPSVSASSVYTVNLMVAYDEEWSYTARVRYWYSAETLARILIDDTFYDFFTMFQITYCIITYVSWDSDDSVTSDVRMVQELVTETGFYSGMYVAGSPVDVLIGFSDQDTIGVYGITNTTAKAVLVMETYLETYYSVVGQCTQNVLQHELSHLYGAVHHKENGLMCVMNLYPYWLGFPYSDPVPTGVITDDWCSDCLATISANREALGREYNHNSGGGGRIYFDYV